MQRVAWTDERLDDLSRRMDAGFDRVDRDVRELRSEMHAGFTEVRGEINQLRAVMYRFGVLLMGTLAASMILDRV
ncbi:MAG: hypothetical protein WBL45_07565 [Solirubrobacterales bacterium]